MEWDILLAVGAWEREGHPEALGMGALQELLGCGLERRDELREAVSRLVDLGVVRPGTIGRIELRRVVMGLTTEGRRVLRGVNARTAGGL
jgi:hypothetical protein